MTQPSLPKGTRDFGPAQMAKRYYIIERIRQVFQNYGFQPLETPAMENLDTLTGKYGEEGDQLLFKILNSGDFFGALKARLVVPIDEALQPDIKRFVLSACQKNQGKTRESVNLEELIESQFGGSTYQQQLREFFTDEANKDSLIESILDAKTDLDIERLTVFIETIFNSYSTRALLQKTTSKDLVSKEEISISEKGLRYDLTVPFARYVVMNRHEIALPFKRFQIQPVWRADRPQKGRYREFYQCDADVVGTDSLICEAEIILMIKEVFALLGITHYSIKVNHRGILSGLAELAGAQGNETALFVAIDKLDKIGEEKVKEELRSKGFNDQSLTTVFDILNFTGSNEQKIQLLKDRFAQSEQGQKGVGDFAAVMQLLTDYGADHQHVDFDISLARGLSYYTGCIFEVKINNVAIGSVSGGGRYDNLTQAFGSKEKLSGVGISFGIDRLYDAMEELKLFPQEAQISSKILICHLDEASQRYALGVAHQLRQHRIAAEVYPDTAKVKKQLEYANKKGVPYTIVVGSEEMTTGELALKNMQSGEQVKMKIEMIVEKVK